MIYNVRSSAQISVIFFRVKAHVQGLVIITNVREPALTILQLIRAETQIEKNYIIAVLDPDPLLKRLSDINMLSINVIRML